nr:CKLF-like MARVEL transmembrane domain-containing protein 8 isoform X1 [Dasypus novemcinctus]
MLPQAKECQDSSVTTRTQEGAWDEFFPAGVRGSVALPTASFQISSLRSHKTISSVVLSHLICGAFCYGSSSKLRQWCQNERDERPKMFTFLSALPLLAPAEEVLRGELGRHRSEKGHGHRQRQSASHGTAGLPAAARERERTGPADVLVLDSSGPKTASRACVSMEVPSSCTSRPPWWMRPPSRLRGTVTTSTAGRPPRFLPSWSPSATLETRISVL